MEVGTDDRIIQAKDALVPPPVDDILPRNSKSVPCYCRYDLQVLLALPWQRSQLNLLSFYKFQSVGVAELIYLKRSLPLVSNTAHLQLWVNQADS